MTTPQTAMPDLDFLHQPPQAVTVEQSADADDLLPQSDADALLKLEGVDGAWIERDVHGQRFVVLYCSDSASTLHLPSSVRGLVVRVVRGGPIRAGS